MCGKRAGPALTRVAIQHRDFRVFPNLWTISADTCDADPEFTADLGGGAPKRRADSARPGCERDEIPGAKNASRSRPDSRAARLHRGAPGARARSRSAP